MKKMPVFPGTAVPLHRSRKSGRFLSMETIVASITDFVTVLRYFMDFW